MNRSIKGERSVDLLFFFWSGAGSVDFFFEIDIGGGRNCGIVYINDFCFKIEC